jgi:NADH:ubiquinone oxidoreductase subunit F (NADH-binding)
MTMLYARPMTSRLLGDVPSEGTVNLAQHIRAHGPAPIPDEAYPAWRESILLEIERSGLTGRGGAGFPSFRKAHAMNATGSHRVLLVNGMEGEPASTKDQYLLTVTPHLVLDGAETLAMALGAAKVVVCVPRARRAVVFSLTRALAERRSLRQPGPGFELAQLAEGYVRGEESALVSAVAGKGGTPSFRPDKAVPLHIGRQPALVHNAETLAHIAMVARYGGQWFSQVGAAEAPGTCLITVSGAVAHPGVLEVDTGTPIEHIIALAGAPDVVQAVLVGGYGGTWVSADEAATPFSPSALRAVGAAMGAGALAVLPVGACGLAETQRMASYMAGESAGQCGPCVFGLPAIATDLDLLAKAEAGQQDLERLRSRCRLVAGRGACRHPDGVAKLVESALRVFGADVERHLASRGCPNARRAGPLAFPNESRRRWAA